MLRTLFISFICLLLIASCAKKDEGPASLEGHWAAESQTDYVNQVSGGLVAEGPASLVGAWEADITPDSLNYFYINNGSRLRTNYFAYTRQGNLLTNLSTGATIEVTELTAHALTLRFNSLVPTRVAYADYRFTR